MKGLNGKVSDLEKAAAQRKAKLDENSAFLQFNWKADVVESWIGKRHPESLTLPGQGGCLLPGEEAAGMWWIRDPAARQTGRPLLASGQGLRQSQGLSDAPGPHKG